MEVLSVNLCMRDLCGLMIICLVSDTIDIKNYFFEKIIFQRFFMKTEKAIICLII